MLIVQMLFQKDIKGFTIGARLFFVLWNNRTLAEEIF